MSKYFLRSENFTSIHIQITTMPFGSKNARMPKEAVITRERRFKEPINATIHIYIHFQSCLGFWWHPAHIAPFLLVSGSYIEYSRIYDTTLIIFKTGSNSSPRSKQGFSIMRALDASLLAPILYTRPTLVCSAKRRMVKMTKRRIMKVKMAKRRMVKVKMTRARRRMLGLEEVPLTANLSLTLGTKTLTTHATLLSPPLSASWWSARKDLDQVS